MLRVTFHCTNERTFDNVMKGLSVVAEQSGKDPTESFSVYNVNTLRSGADVAFGIELVEIHNQEDNVFSSAMDQVISSIQRQPTMDNELQKFAHASSFSHSEKKYCMLPGNLFSAVPGALGWVVRNACPQNASKTGRPPAVLRLAVQTKSITAVLDILNQMNDVALKSSGLVGCLVQGIESYENSASLMFLFASDIAVLAFAQDAQIQLLARAAKVAAGGLDVTMAGEVSAFAQRAVNTLIDSL